MKPENPQVVIATVGKQPMPILIPILQMAPASVQLIVTEEVQDVAQNIRTALRLDSQRATARLYAHEPVNPYVADHTYQRCKAILQSPRWTGRQFAINVTGGTTLMALGARQAAREFGVPMLYVDTDDGVIVHFQPDGTEIRYEDISVRVPVDVYMAAHGASVSLRRPWGKGVVRDESWTPPFVEAARRVGRAGARSAQLLDTIRGICSGPAESSGDPIVFSNATDEEHDLAKDLAARGLLVEFLDEASGFHFRVPVDNKVREFLGGHWLELYVYDACVTSRLFDNVLLSVQVTRQATPQPVVNELDVVVTRRGRLAVVSCKTERLTERNENKEAVYELDSLLQTELMGLYARKVLVTNHETLPPALVSRAMMSQTRCVTGAELQDVAQIIKAHLAE